MQKCTFKTLIFRNYSVFKIRFVPLYRKSPYISKRIKDLIFGWITKYIEKILGSYIWLDHNLTKYLLFFKYKTNFEYYILILNFRSIQVHLDSTSGFWTLLNTLNFRSLATMFPIFFNNSTPWSDPWAEIKF
jgi:hypothetical protein